MENIKKVLVLAPHTDDAELSCAATLNKLRSLGCTIHYAVFSFCYESVPEGYPRDILKKEMRNATDVLGVEKEHIYEHEYRVRYFPQERQSILEDLIKIRSKVSPDLVLMPSSFDIHQDHETIHREGLRAFKNTRILGYEFPWNNIDSKINFLVSIERKDLQVKIDAINCYETQSFRNYKDEEFFFGLARIRGVQANCEYAEGFELIKWIF